jgi:hypothetical protein
LLESKPRPHAWPDLPASVMPVRDDMHRSGGAARRADHAQADARPRLILREGVEPHVDPAIATAVQALDTAGHMAVGQPFSRAAGRIMAGPFCVSTASAHAAHQSGNVSDSQIIDP